MTDDLAARTDSYFLKTKAIVGRFGDREATYAVFMRRPVICTPRLAIEFLERMATERGTSFEIELNHPEAAWVGAGEPILYLTGPLSHLVDLETVLLQKIGPPCVAAYNASAMCADLPKVAFLAMDARHCAGAEMAEMMAYAAAVGSAHARKVAGAIGFVGCAAAATAHFFGRAQGMGTMPHALIGYAGSTVRAAEMFHETFADEPLTVLVDYFGQETSDAVAVARRFPELAAVRPPRLPHGHPGRALLRGARPRPLVRGARTPCAAVDPRLSHRGRAALSGRHRGLRRGVVAPAPGAERGRVSRDQDRRQLGLQPGEMPDDGGRERADRRHRHRLLPARAMERDLRDGRHHRL